MAFRLRITCQDGATEVQIVYILGSTRSGTSAVRNALAETRYKGYGEGHLVKILVDLIACVRRERVTGQGATIQGNGLNALRERVLIRNFFHGYERYLTESLGGSFLMDKTPNIIPIQNAVDLHTFHQKATFLHCARRHVDNIQSKLKKFPDQSFASQCREWAECHLAWERAKPGLKGSYVEFDFMDMVVKRHEVCQNIGDLLGLDAHEVKAVFDYLENERPQSATPDRDLARFLKFSEMTWSDADKDVFLRVCGPVGDKLGYGLESYYA